VAHHGERPAGPPSVLAPFSICRHEFADHWIGHTELAAADLEYGRVAAHQSPGYVVRYGTAPDALDIQVRIDNPGLVTYVVSDLTPATWYFQVVAYNSVGVESSPSATGSKTIS